MSLLQVSHLFKFNNGAVVLDDVYFSYPTFRRLAVAGETGSGKTTLLKAIAGLVQPDGGGIFFEGEKVAGPHERLLPGHPRIAYLSQHFELRNNYTVDDYLEMASKVDKQQRRRIYELCQVDHLLQRKTDQLSGGERQRTALARLLTTKPRILLLDEPYSNLDGLHKQTLKAVINDIVEEGETACLMVSHDPIDVLPWAEEVLVMKEGRIVQQGTPEQVYRQPKSDYVGGLFGDYNLLLAAQMRTIFSLPEAAGDKQYFLRPENISIKKENSGQNGVVSAVLFFGSFYEVEVECNGFTLFVKTSRSDFQKGDRVSVAVDQTGIWPLEESIERKG